MEQKQEHIVIVQLARFGDLIQSSPLIRNLKREAGYVRSITLVVDARTAEIARLLDDVDTVIEIDLETGANLIHNRDFSPFRHYQEWIRSWKPRKTYDRLILLNEGKLPAAIAAIIPAKIKTGPLEGSDLSRPHKYLSLAVTDRRFNPLHLCEVWAAYGRRILPLPEPKIKETHFGTGIAFCQIEERDKSRKNNRFALNLGAGAAGRRLSKEKLAGIAKNLLLNDDCEIFLLGVVADKEIASFVFQRIPEDQRDKIRDFTGKTGIRELAALLNHCDVLISSDTGTLQLSAATKATPLGFFFGGANPGETGPYKTGSVALFDKKSFDQTDLESSDFSSRLNEKSVALLAWRICRNEPFDQSWRNEQSISLLLARSSPVGPEYRPLETEQETDLLPQRRWQSLARTFLWGTPLEEDNSSWFMGGEKNETIQSDRFCNARKLAWWFERNTHSPLNDWMEKDLMSPELCWVMRLINAFREDYR